MVDSVVFKEVRGERSEFAGPLPSSLAQFGCYVGTEGGARGKWKGRWVK